MKQLRLSFDFDGSIERESLQKYAEELVQRGHEVWIVTRRYSDINNYTKEFCKQYGITNLIHEHKHLFTVAAKCGIKPENIHFMDMVEKYHFFQRNESFLWHLDDDYIECREINQNTKTVAVSCANGSNWRHKCERLIKKKLNEISV